jgi:hypothetical protein
MNDIPWLIFIGVLSLLSCSGYFQALRVDKKLHEARYCNRALKEAFDSSSTLHKQKENLLRKALNAEQEAHRVTKGDLANIDSAYSRYTREVPKLHKELKLEKETCDKWKNLYQTAHSSKCAFEKLLTSVQNSQKGKAKELQYMRHCIHKFIENRRNDRLSGKWSEYLKREREIREKARATA